MFGDAGAPAPTSGSCARQQRSILDAVMDKIAGLQGRLDGEDRRELVNYLDAVREIERCIEIAQRQADRELHVLYPKGENPMTNLQLTMLRKLGGARGALRRRHRFAEGADRPVVALFTAAVGVNARHPGRLCR